MNLIADIGNTFVKIAVFESGRLVADRCVERLTPQVIDSLTAGRRAERAIYASTRDATEEVAEVLRTRSDYVLEFGAQTPVPIRNAYRTPATLGRDRLAAAVGAKVLYPGRNVLIADFGTAVTVDLVTADGEFRGGCISPGMQTRFRALHDYTACLPLCTPHDDEGLQGLTTEEAIRLGVMNSVTFEIEGYIARMSEKIDDLCVIFTGGDAKYFVKRIKNTIFANRNLVFCGLDRILEYNASEEHLD